MLRIAVLASGGGTNLQALLDAEANGALRSGKITLVVSNRADAYALSRARAAGVETAVVKKGRDESPAAYGQRLLAILRAAGIGMIVLTGFLLILDDCVIRAYERRILNIHPSLIPAFCGKGFYGLKVHEAALDRGVKVTGATVHLVNGIPDGGPILAQRAVEVLDGDTPETLQRRVMERAEWVLLPRETERWARKLTEEAM